MKAASSEQREVMQRLKLSRDGTDFYRYLTDALADAHLRLARADNPVRMHVIQGEVQTLLELTKYLNPVS